MDKKVIISIAVAAAFLLLYPYYMKRISPPAPNVPIVVTSTEVGTGADVAKTSGFDLPADITPPAPPTSATEAVMGKFKNMVGLGRLQGQEEGCACRKGRQRRG